jgi:hypothetical protein
MSDQRNRLANGRFLNDLANWTAFLATYSAGDGDDHYGVAVIPVTGYVEQSFSVPAARAYSLHLSVKGAGGSISVAITDSNGNALPAGTASGAADWTETTLTFGLAPGTTYTLRLTGSGAAVKLDDAWLWWVPMTRARLAARVHDRLARLATDRSLNTTPAGVLTEGSYTYAVDAGLRSVGAIDPETDLPDVRWLEAAMLDTALDAVELEMLKKLQRDYAVEVDTQLGPRREDLSQIAKAVGGMTGGAGGGGRVVMRKLRHEATDYELGDG